MIQIKKILKNEYFTYDSKPISVKASQKYRVRTTITRHKGEKFCGYFMVFFIDSEKRGIGKKIRWLNDFIGKQKEYSIVFSVPENAQKVKVGYRINGECPVKSEVEIELQEPSTIKLEEVTNDLKEEFDNYKQYVIPKLKQLSEEEENILEKNVVWLLGTPRSGSTWLGTQLLRHKENIIWQEPWIGRHLNVNLYGDLQINEGQYFFSLHHKANWLPALKKFILARIYSHAQEITKKVIIKEPNGTMAADIIIEAFPNSRIIWLARDLRDVIDSLIDAQQSGSWNKKLSNMPIKTKEQLYKQIQKYTKDLSSSNLNLWTAFQNHDSNLKYFLKYEDLKKNTFVELKKIYNFIDIEIKDEELKQIIEIYDFKKIPNSQKGTGKFYRAASTGGWKNHFDKKEQELLNSGLIDILKKMGYSV